MHVQHASYCRWTKSISHHLIKPGMMIPLYIPTNNGLPLLQSGAGFHASTESGMHMEVGLLSCCVADFLFDTSYIFISIDQLEKHVNLNFPVTQSAETVRYKHP